MRISLAVLSALGLVVGLTLAEACQAAGTGVSGKPNPSDGEQCAIAAAAIRLKLAPSAGMKLAYGSDLPDDKGVTEGAWTPRMFVPFLREFDARSHVSAIPVCAALQAELITLGARVVTGRAFDEAQWGVPKSERTAVLRVTLPILSADGTRALVRAENRCGFGCGSGDTYQFVRDGDGWKHDALRVEWSGTVGFKEDGRQIGQGR